MLCVQAGSREHLGHRLVRSISQTFIVSQTTSSVEERAELIVGLARVKHRMKLVSQSCCVRVLYVRNNVSVYLYVSINNVLTHRQTDTHKLLSSTAGGSTREYRSKVKMEAVLHQEKEEGCAGMFPGRALLSDQQVSSN